MTDITDNTISITMDVSFIWNILILPAYTLFKCGKFLLLFAIALVHLCLMGGLFIGKLCTIPLGLLSYKGVWKIDRNMEFLFEYWYDNLNSGNIPYAEPSDTFLVVTSCVFGGLILLYFYLANYYK